MNKKIKWHIYVLIPTVILLSAFSWKKMLNKIKLDTSNGSTSTIDTVVSQLDESWNSAVVRKSAFSKIDSVLTYIITGQIISNQVVEGQNGWLFYKCISDGDPIADYEGTNSFSQDEKNSMLESVLRVQNDAEKKGIRFAVLVPPNKENVYYKFMPNIYSHAQYSRTDDLINYLQNNGVHVVSPKDELIRGIENHQLYYTTDTHWNYLGAYVGLKKMLSEWDIDIPPLSNIQISKDSCKGGDLSQLAGLDDFFYDTEYTIDEYEWPEIKIEQISDNAFYYLNSNAAISGVLLLVGDSFSESMIPTLVNVFSEVYIVHRDSYTPGMLEEIKPDYMIMEYVERYSSSISKMDTLIYG